jgi:hypothetical protein
MPVSGKLDQAKDKKRKLAPSSKGAKFDVVFGGPLLLVPTQAKGNVTGLEVFFPRNGHPVGATFLPGVWFSDADLNDPECENWPDIESLSLLDPHSYAIDLTQVSKKPLRSFPVKSIPETNHKVKAGRRISHDWDISITLTGQISSWASLRVSEVKEGNYSGSDSPVSSHTASMHRITYSGVIAAEFCGAPKEAKEYLKANSARGGTLILMGETPFHPTLLHERQAVDALAKLAGLDLHLMVSAPTPRPSRIMHHTAFCGLSAVVI